MPLVCPQPKGPTLPVFDDESGDLYEHISRTNLPSEKQPQSRAKPKNNYLEYSKTQLQTYAMADRPHPLPHPPVATQNKKVTFLEANPTQVADNKNKEDLNVLAYYIDMAFNNILHYNPLYNAELGQSKERKDVAIIEKSQATNFYGASDDEHEAYIRQDEVMRQKMVPMKYKGHNSSAKRVRRPKPLPQPKLPPTIPLEHVQTSKESGDIFAGNLPKINRIDDEVKTRTLRSLTKLYFKNEDLQRV